MPELPEVEVVKKSLERELRSLTIKKVKIYDGNLRYKVKKQDFNKIIGLKILKIKRRSKYLLFFLSGNYLILAHLGMTGKFLILKKDNFKLKTSFYYQTETLVNKHNRIQFFFNNKIRLIYNDVRKFGFIKVDKTAGLKLIKHINKLGPEPLSRNLNFNYFKRFINGKKRSIKELLMDQKFISGIGNIYANEILFRSKIKPNRGANKLKSREIIKLVYFTKKILRSAINFGGSSIKNFSNTIGKTGNFQQHFNVYAKNGKKCSNADCKGIIKKMVISGRASFYCSICQKY